MQLVGQRARLPLPHKTGCLVVLVCFYHQISIFNILIQLPIIHACKCSHQHTKEEYLTPFNQDLERGRKCIYQSTRCLHKEKGHFFFLEEGSCLPFYVCAAFFSFFTVLNGNHMRKTPWIVKNTA